MQELGLPASTPIAVCYNHPKAKLNRYKRDDPRRKPQGGMLRELAEAAGIPLARVLYIGDRPEDKQAAADAGVRFVWAGDFFLQNP